jgi:hypothetical protein
MTERELLDEAVEVFAEVRGLSYDFLAALSPARLTMQLPRPDLDTFGKHFQELGDVQDCYVTALRRGVMDFGVIRHSFDQALIRDKDSLASFLRSKDEAMGELLAGCDCGRRIAWAEGDSVSLVEFLSSLTRHEIFHHGQMVAFAYQAGVPLPASWTEQWALPTRAGELYPA